MRILHILDHSLPLHSGYAFRTISILREQRRRGWETSQLTSPRHGVGGALQQEVDGWLFHRTRLSSHGIRGPLLDQLREMAATSRRIETLIREFRPNILHAHSPVLNAMPAIHMGWIHRVPVVYEVRALWEDAAVDHGTASEGGLRYRLSRALETHALRRVDHVTTICEGLRDEIIGRGIPHDRVTVVPNGVDADTFEFDVPADQALRASLGFGDASVVGFVGSFYGYEGLDLLIDALGMLTSRQPAVRLLLVGGGPQEAALKALVENRGLADRVVFAGRVPHSEVRRYYSLVDVLAYPRRRMRLTDLVTPLKPLEAMAQGKVVVASDVGGHRELVTDGETGFLFPAGDVRALAEALGRALQTRCEWPALCARARQFVATERSWQRSVDHYAPVYTSLVSQKSRQATSHVDQQPCA